MANVIPSRRQLPGTTKLLIATALALGITAALSSFASSPTSVFLATVTKNGQPVVGVRVYLECPSVIVAAATNAKGSADVRVRGSQKCTYAIGDGAKIPVNLKAGQTSSVTQGL